MSALWGVISFLQSPRSILPRPLRAGVGGRDYGIATRAVRSKFGFSFSLIALPHPTPLPPPARGGGIETTDLIAKAERASVRSVRSVCFSRGPTPPAK